VGGGRKGKIKHTDTKQCRVVPSKNARKGRNEWDKTHGGKAETWTGKADKETAKTREVRYAKVEALFVL